MMFFPENEHIIEGSISKHLADLTLVVRTRQVLNQGCQPPTSLNIENW